MFFLGGVFVILAAAYYLVGRFLERAWGISSTRRTPAVKRGYDGEYAPTKPLITFGQHFSAITSFSVIAGPIIAARYGWAPVFMWLIAGAICIGAVYDFAALYLSVRNGSIADSFELYAGKTGRLLFSLFVWIFCAFFSAALIDVTANFFDGFLSPMPLTRNKTNGSVSSSSIFLTCAALFLGYLMRKFKTSTLATFIITVDLLVVSAICGVCFPIYIGKDVWVFILLVYVIASSLLPVWTLEQPRGYMSACLILPLMAAAVVGGFSAQPAMLLPAVSNTASFGDLFPDFFLLVSCGAVSGFSGLTAAGITSKQIITEKHLRPIGIGAMFVDTVIAALALIAVGSISVNGSIPDAPASTIFAAAISGMIRTMGLSPALIYFLINLAMATFTLTTLSCAVRLGIFSLRDFLRCCFAVIQAVYERFFGKKMKRAAWTHAAFRNGKTEKRICRIEYSTCAAGLFTALGIGFLISLKMGYAALLPYIGAANQLIAVLILAVAAVFLKVNGYRWRALLPALIFLSAVSFTFIAKSLHTLCGAWTDGGISIRLRIVYYIFLLTASAVILISCFLKQAIFSHLSHLSYQTKRGVPKNDD
jgi:carbon starvation protein